MRPERNILEVDSNLDGDDVVMEIAAGAMNKMAGILTDMYSDNELAPIRELSCNARDSHVAAGQERPIEVTVGKQGSQLTLPVLRIQDWGLGLDEEEVKNVYSKYGASTKDDSDDFVGMLGIGSKSPLAYTDQFIVQAVKNGHKIVVMASRNDDGSLIMTILDGGETDEENGVTVEVPVKPQNELLAKANNFFRFWERGTVLVNGQEPTPVEETEGAFQLTDSIVILNSENEPSRTDYIVMGNVPYPTDLGFYESGYYGDNKFIVARVGIGGVSFTPAREALMDSERTKKTLAAIKHEFKSACQTTVQQAVDGAASHGEALKAFMEARDALPKDARPNVSDLKYKGETLPDFPEIYGANALSNAGHKYSTGKRKPELNTIADGIWVTDWTNTTFTGGQREKLRLFLIHVKGLEDNYAVSKRALFLIPEDKPPHAKWVPKDLLFSWSDVQAWKVPSTVAASAYGSKVITGSYWSHQPGQSGIVELDAQNIDPAHTYWIQCGKYEGTGGTRWHRTTNWLEAIREEDPQATLVMLSTNRVEKFNRDFPTVPSVKEAKATKVRAKIKALSKDTILALYIGEDVAEAFAKLERKANEIDDGDLVRMVELSKLAVKKRPSFRILQSEARNWSVDIPTAKDPAIAQSQERYPLVKAVYGGGPIEDLILYVNAAYAARKEAS